MDIYTGTTEIDTYLKERYEKLPPALKASLADESLFQQLAERAEDLGLTDEKTEQLKYCLILVLLQLKPVDELAVELVTDFGLEYTTALNFENWIHTNLLQSVLPLLINLPDEETGRESLEREANVNSPVTTSNTPTRPAVPKPDPIPQMALSQQNSPQPVQKTPEIITPATTERPSTLTKTRTMQRDIHAINRTNGSEASQSANTQNTVPRYAKPLTDTPQYNDGSSRS